MNLTRILLNHGLLDWGGDPVTRETAPDKFVDNFKLAGQLYVPKRYIVDVDLNKGYMTTYIPLSDFLIRGKR